MLRSAAAAAVGGGRSAAAVFVFICCQLPILFQYSLKKHKNQKKQKSKNKNKKQQQHTKNKTHAKKWSTIEIEMESKNQGNKYTNTGKTKLTKGMFMWAPKAFNTKSTEHQGRCITLERIAQRNTHQTKPTGKGKPNPKAGRPKGQTSQTNTREVKAAKGKCANTQPIARSTKKQNHNKNNNKQIKQNTNQKQKNKTNKHNKLDLRWQTIRILRLALRYLASAHVPAKSVHAQIPPNWSMIRPCTKQRAYRLCFASPSQSRRKKREGARRGAKGCEGVRRGAKGREGARRTRSGARAREGARRGARGDAKGREGARRSARGREGARRGAKGWRRVAKPCAGKAW
jgi:hypothetical protein